MARNGSSVRVPGKWKLQGWKSRVIRGGDGSKDLKLLALVSRPLGVERSRLTMTVDPQHHPADVRRLFK